jgi:hypothetical protein
MGTKINVFKNYMNPIFFETGSYVGDGIQFAIDAGFEEIYSVELSQEYFDICKNRFNSNLNVKLILGDSCEKILENIIEIDKAITFWLDGHYSCGNTALGKYWTPLIQELDQIKQHKIKTHTILIDDMQFWIEDYKDKHGFIKDDIISKLYEINSEYNISFIDGAVKNDILVCKIQ